MGNFIENLFQSKNATPLPWAIILTLFFIMTFNSMTVTMAFAFLPNLVKSFGKSEVETGYYAGIIATSLFIGTTSFSILWGALADSKGNKKMLLLSTTGLAFSTLLFGFSYSISWAAITRFIQGSFMGVIVIAKSIVADVCDDTNVTLGMTLLMSSYSLGLIIGPSFGGFLSFPAKQYPKTFSTEAIFGKFVVLLPNLLCVIGFMIGSFLVVIFVPKDRKKQKVGENAKLISSYENETFKYASVDEQNNKDDLVNSDVYCNLSIQQSIKDEERKNEKLDKYGVRHFQLIKSIPKINISNGCCTSFTKENFMNSSFVKILRSKDCMSVIIIFCTYSVPAIGYQELFPLYAATSKGYGGLAFDPSDIGLNLVVVSSVLLVLQMFLCSRLTARFGALRVFIFSLLLMAIFVPFIPLLNLISNKYLLWAFTIIVLCLTNFPMAVGFVCVNILLNNSVTSDLRSSANGFCMAVASLGRAISPVAIGSMYSWSLTQRKEIQSNQNPIGFPFNEYFAFLVLSLTLILTAIVASRLPKRLDKMQPSLAGQNKINDFNEKNITRMSISQIKFLVPKINDALDLRSTPSSYSHATKRS